MSKDKEIFDFSNYSAKSKYYDDSNKLVVDKVKDETADVTFKEFSDHKKAKDVDKNVAATISHKEYKDVLLNNKCLRHSMNRIQSKNRRIRTYQISKISFSCFDD